MKGCYGKGGKIRPKTIHGLKTGQHNNPNVLRAGRASGGECSAPQVDGKRGRTNLSRKPFGNGGGATSDTDMEFTLPRIPGSGATSDADAKFGRRASGGKVMKREEGGGVFTDRLDQTKPPESAPIEPTMAKEGPNEISTDRQRSYLNAGANRARKEEKSQRFMKNVGRVVSLIPKQGIGLRTVNTMNANNSADKEIAARDKASKLESEADKFNFRKNGGKAK